jgi:hypothetical protein
MKYLYFSLAVWLTVFSGCRVTDVSVNTYNPPVEAKDGSKDFVLLVNGFDPREKKYRENKQELFGNLVRNMLGEMREEIMFRSAIDSKILPDTTFFAQNDLTLDSTLFALLENHNATHAIIVHAIDVFFTQTGVEVTRTESGKEREAFYDISADVFYSWYKKGGNTQKERIQINRFHSSRNVASGFLAAGPNIVKNESDAAELLRENYAQFLDKFFFHKIPVSRKIFIEDFPGVRKFINTNNFDAAFRESFTYVTDKNLAKAAKANYNCAVLTAKKNQFSQSKSFLERSLALHRLDEAVEMMKDVWAIEVP